MKIYAYLVAGMMLMGIFAGVYQAGKLSERVVYMKRIDDLKDEIEKARTQYETEVAALTEAMLNRKPERTTNYETITQEVPKYISNEHNCDISYGGYSLLHTASADGQPSHYASLTDAEKKQPALTAAEAFSVTIEWGREYHDTVDQLHTLQNVVRKLSCVN